MEQRRAPLSALPRGDDSARARSGEPVRRLRRNGKSHAPKSDGRRARSRQKYSADAQPARVPGMKGVTRGPARFRRSHSPGAVHAVLRRELRAALLNRYLQLFSALALAAGIAAVASAETEGAAPFFL